MLFQSPGPDVLNAPDNIGVSPRGGLVLCEDGSGEEFLHGLTVDREICPSPRWQMAICESSEPGYHVRDHWSLEIWGTVMTMCRI